MPALCEEGEKIYSMEVIPERSGKKGKKKKKKRVRWEKASGESIGSHHPRMQLGCEGALGEI